MIFMYFDVRRVFPGFLHSRCTAECFYQAEKLKQKGTV